MRRISAVVGALAVAVLLSGCVPGLGAPPVAPAAPGNEVPAATPADGARDGHCGDGQDIVLDGQAKKLTVTGSCGTVTVKGQALTVAVAHASGLELDGQAIVVTVGSGVGGLQINGNGNTVIGDGDPATSSVSGQGNAVQRR